MKEAMFYQRLEGNKIKCYLCNHRCIISPGEKGICKVRVNEGGVLYSLVYGKVVAHNVDPVEKKPLFHFYPGSKIYSIETAGCNFHCLYCQNWRISQLENGEIMGEELAPDDIIENAVASKCNSIAYTYTEPTIFYEYAFDIAKIAHKRALKNIFITNGYISEEALRNICPYLDAANIDLKSMSDTFYGKICGAKLKPVLDSIKLCYTLGIWLEITTLIIPGYNDSTEELKEIAGFIREIDKSIPWHVSRFYPAYKLTTVPPTPSMTLEKAVAIGKKTGSENVYQGNIGEGEDTFCPRCRRRLIKRASFTIVENKIKNWSCPYCGKAIAGMKINEKEIKI